MNASLLPIADMSYLDIMASEQSNMGMHFWIASKDFIYDGIDCAGLSRLRVYSPKLLLNAVASDCNRLAIASCESFCGITVGNLERNGLAWTIIRLYYATFFAVHALARLFGHSCTNVSPEHAKIIEDLLSLNSPQVTKVKKGTYDFYCTPDGAYSTFTSIDHSHVGAWKIFVKIIDNIKENIEPLSTTSQNKLSIIETLDVVRYAVGAQGSNMTAWLSNFRNDVNYQHRHNAWYPSKIGKGLSKCLPTVPTVWKLSNYRYSYPVDSGVLSFFHRSSIVLRFFYDVVIACEIKNNGAGKILKNGFFKLLRSIKC